MRRELRRQIVSPTSSLRFSYTSGILQHKAYGTDKLPKLFSLLFLMLNAFRSSLSSNNLISQSMPSFLAQ